MMHSVDVCIVGAGFSGLLAAILVSQRGGTCCIIEKHAITSGSISNAHYLNAYSLEILSAAGLSIDALRAVAVDDEIDKRMVVCHTLNRTLAQVNLLEESDYEDRFSRIGRFGACLNVRASHLHAMLVTRANELGIDIRSQHQVLSLDFSNHLVHVQDSVTMDSASIQCGYLMGCDGAQSQIAQLSSRFVSREQEFQYFFTVECHGSIRQFVQDPALFYWVYHEQMIACLVNFDIDHLQVLQVPVMSGQASTWTENHIRECFSAILDIPTSACQHRFTIRGEWALKTARLDQAQTDNWVYFCGDAFHQVLPAGGLGLNQALADVFNLIWKLDLDQQSLSSVSILDTYACERTPVADKVIEQSIDNYQQFMSMASQFLGGADQSWLRWVSNTLPRSLCQPMISSWLRTIRSLHDVGYISSSWDHVMRLNRTHFDGMSMHYAAKYTSRLIFEPSQRIFYALDTVPHALYVGYRLQSFTCRLNGKIVYLSDCLKYSQWTIVFVAGGVGIPDMLSGAMGRFQVLSIDDDCQSIHALPLRASHCILIRPDRYLAAHIDLTDRDCVRRFSVFCQSLMSCSI